MFENIRKNGSLAPPGTESNRNSAFGWVPLLSVVIALSLLIMAFGISGSRAGLAWAQPVFWFGFLVMLVPAAVRLCMRDAGRSERVGILILLSLGYYLIKVLYSPMFFSFNDELQHMRSMNEIIDTDRLFQDNPTLNVSAYFPGLELITHALLTITGLSIFQSALMVMGVAHTLIGIALFLLYERISHSDYVAGIATLLFFASPSYMLGYSQFAYEPLALSLFYFALYLLVVRVNAAEYLGRWRVGFLMLLLLSAVVVTHHITSYFMIAMLFLWAFIAFTHKEHGERRMALLGFSVFAAAAALTWVVMTGSLQLVSGYVGDPIFNAVKGISELIAGNAPPRVFFKEGAAAGATPLWMQIPSYISVLLIALTIPLGLWVLWKHSRNSNLSVVLGLLSLGYFVAQGLRLNPSGLALTNRLASPLFLALGFILAIGTLRFSHARIFSRLAQWILAGWVCLILIGSATAVVASWQLPGEYNRDIFTRRIERQGIAAARWAARTLGPEHRFGADFTNMLIMGSYGSQDVVTEEDDFFAETSLFKSTSFGEVEKDYIGERGVEYLVIDNRRENELILRPQIPNPNSYPTLLDKQESISRIYDSGVISIYHLGFVAPFDSQLDMTTEAPER